LLFSPEEPDQNRVANVSRKRLRHADRARHVLAVAEASGGGFGTTQTSQSGRATGSVRLVERSCGAVYYAKLRLPDGRQVQRKLGAAWTRRGRPEGGSLTQRMAEARLRELLVEAERGTLAAINRSGDGHTFEDAAAEYLRYVEHERQRRPSTLRDYRNTINCYLLPALGREAVADITGASSHAGLQPARRLPTTRGP